MTSSVCVDIQPRAAKSQLMAKAVQRHCRQRDETGDQFGDEWRDVEIVQRHMTFAVCDDIKPRAAKFQSMANVRVDGKRSPETLQAKGRDT